MGGGERIPSMKVCTYDVLESLYEEIETTVRDIQSNRQMPRHSIRIWMPEYFNKMLRLHLVRYRPGVLPHYPEGDLTELNGVKILDGYRNNIVIGHRECARLDIRPVMIIIP